MFLKTTGGVMQIVTLLMQFRIIIILFQLGAVLVGLYMLYYGYENYGVAYLREMGVNAKHLKLKLPHIDLANFNLQEFMKSFSLKDLNLKDLGLDGIGGEAKKTLKEAVKKK